MWDFAGSFILFKCIPGFWHISLFWIIFKLVKNPPSFLPFIAHDREWIALAICRVGMSGATSGWAGDHMNAHSKPQAVNLKPLFPWVSWDSITVFARIVWSSVGALQLNMSRACLGALPKVKHLCQSCVCLGVVFDNNIWHLLSDILFLGSHPRGFPSALLWKSSRENTKAHVAKFGGGEN